MTILACLGLATCLGTVFGLILADGEFRPLYRFSVGFTVAFAFTVAACLFCWLLRPRPAENVAGRALCVSCAHREDLDP